MIGQIICESLFVMTALMILGGSVLVVSSHSLVHSVLGLIASLLGVAGMYLQLGSPFMSAMQILIYVGAVCIIIVFAIMLAEPGAKGITAKPERFFLLVSMLVIFLGVAGIHSQFSESVAAAMQAVVFIGAAGFLIVLAIMLADSGAKDLKTEGGLLLIGSTAAIVSFVVIINILQKTTWQSSTVSSADASIAAIGKHLLVDFGLVFEVISLVLLVAIMGAIVLARGGRGKAE